jgi:hypothetical protein
LDSAVATPPRKDSGPKLNVVLRLMDLDAAEDGLGLAVESSCDADPVPAVAEPVHRLSGEALLKPVEAPAVVVDMPACCVVHFWWAVRHADEYALFASDFAQLALAQRQQHIELRVRVFMTAPGAQLPEKPAGDGVEFVIGRPDLQQEFTKLSDHRHLEYVMNILLLFFSPFSLHLQTGYTCAGLLP